MNPTLTSEWIDSIPSKEIEIQIALYKLNDSIHHVPFVTYLLEEHAEMYQFPRFPLSLDKEEAGEEEDILNDTCENECKKQIFKHLNIQPSNAHVINNILFKGYITREGQSEVLAVFEVINSNGLFSMDFLAKKQWVTLHEIINTKRINMKMLNPLVSHWFLENSALIYIKDKYNNAVDIPYVLYLLEETNTTDRNGTRIDKKDLVEEQVAQEKKTSIFDALSNVFQQTKTSETDQSREKSKESNVSKYQSITKNEGLLPKVILWSCCGVLQTGAFLQS